MSRVKRYGIPAVIFLASVVLAILQGSDLTRVIASLPAILALLDLLWQVWRDQLAHERAKELLYSQQDFTLAVASQISGRVFDKQVEFAERYISVLNEAVPHLFRNGPTIKVGEYASELRSIRADFSPWISTDLTKKLIPYEHALSSISTSTQLFEMLPVGPNRTVFVEKAYSTFQDFLGIKETEDNLTEQDAVSAILSHLQDVLGIQDLEELRRISVKAAVDRLMENEGF
jgi:hypothetical protein